MEMRALLAIVLSMVVLTLYQYLFVPPPVQETPPAETETARPQADPGESAPPATATESNAPAAEVEPIAAQDERRIRVLGSQYEAELSNRGGVLRSFVLQEFRNDDGALVDLVHPAARAARTMPLRLQSPRDPSLAAAANEGLHVVEVEGGRREGDAWVPLPESPVRVRFRWGDQRWNVSKEIIFPAQGYQLLVTATQTPSSGPMAMLALGPGANPINGDSRNVFLGEAAPILTGEGLERWDTGDLETPTSLGGYIRWVGVESHYFLTAFLLDRDAEIRLSAVTLPDPASQGAPDAAPLSLVEASVQLGAATEIPVFLGPKKYDLLVDQGYSLREVVDFGWFGIIARPLLALLLWIQGFVGNYGIAIILLTVLLRVVFLPLNHKAMVSMRRTQQLQPQMAAIRAKYKGVSDVAKRQKMNEEVMELYRREGVSPFGGCLPMLAQLPILFAFYRLLSIAIELRGAPFVLWIHDLSQYDPYLVLPLLMGGSMIVQQQMTPTAGVNPAQARMMKLMPIMFTVLFLYVPSGLVLYWLVNNVLGIAQQVYINKRMAGPPTTKPAPTKGKKSQRGKR